MIKRGLAAVFIAVLYLGAAEAAVATGGKAVIKENQCASCHKLKGPAAATLSEVLKRKAPDLFYAGSKFKREFLVRYLQKPYRIRPAGTVYVNNIATGGEEGKEADVIKEPPLCASKLSSGDAEAAADYLMTLKAADMPTGLYKEGERFSKIRAKLIFTKNAVCIACHRIKKKGKLVGGLSSPTLYDAGGRLSGDWVYSYIKDPQQWDPKAWMPRRKLKEKSLMLLTNYLMSMKDE